MDKIDELIAQATPPKIRPRKGTDPLRAAEKPASKDIPALLDEGTRVYNISKGLREGKSTRDIATEYKMSESDIKTLMTKALAKIAEDVGPVILNWSIIQINRLEDMIGKLYPKLMDTNGNPNDVVFARIQNLIAQEKEIINVLMAGSKSKDPLGDLSETMRGDGKLYEEGMIAIHQRGQNGVIEREQPIADLDDPFPEGIVYQA